MDTLRVCFVGDSLTLGVGDPEALGWTGRLVAAERARGLDVTGYNLGVRGDTSEHVARRWRAETAARLPAGKGGLIVFAFGTNDALEEGGRRRVEPARTLAATSAVLAEAAEGGPVLLLGPPPTAAAAENERLGSVSAGLAQAAAAHGVAFLDTAKALEDSFWLHELRGGDGYHPGAGGYAALAAAVASWAPWRRAMAAAGANDEPGGWRRAPAPRASAAQPA